MKDFEENKSLEHSEKPEEKADFEVKEKIADSNQKSESVQKVKGTYGLLRYVNNILSAVFSTFARFPLTILFCISLAAIAIYRIGTPYDVIKDYNELLDRIMGVLALGIPLSLSVDILFERIKRSEHILEKFLWYIVELMLLVVYFFYGIPNTNDVSGIRTAGLTASFALGFLFIPYFLRKENYEIYITRLATRGLISGFYTVVLGAGISATLFAVKSLLYADMSSNYYAYTWVSVWFVFAPIHFLYGLPKIDDEFSIDNYNKILKVLLMYIVMPLIAVYTLVLYIYFGKIVVTRVWPEGIVSYLVLSYTAVGIATVFLITPLKMLSSWVRKFIAVFSKLVLPLLAMMFVSIGIRISEFGVTENRYFIVIIGIWAALAVIYINFNKGRRNIVLAVSLAVVVLISVLGPLSAFNISKMSQNNRFYEILARNNMLQNGQIVKNANINSTDKKELIAILWYFNNIHSFKDLKYVPADFEMQKAENVFGFTQDDITNARYAHEYKYFHYEANQLKALQISGYDSLFRLELYKFRNDSDIIFNEETSVGSEKLKVTVDKKYNFILTRNDAIVYKMDLNEFVKPLYVKYGSQNKMGNVDAKDLIFTNNDEKVELKIIFNRINGNLQSSENGIDIEGIDGYALVKVK